MRPSTDSVTPPPALALATPAETVRHQYAWTMAGFVGLAVSQFSLLVIIAKFSLPGRAETNTGLYALALGMLTPVFLFAQLGLRQSLPADVAGRFSLTQYLTLRVWCGLLAVVAVALYIAVEATTDASAAQSSSYISVLAALALSKTCELGSDFVHAVMQRQLHMIWVGRTMLMRAALLLVVPGLVFAYTSEIGHLAWAVATVSVFALLLDVRQLARRGYLREAAKHKLATHSTTWGLFQATLPLGLVTAVASVQVNLGRYILDAFTSIADVGIYASLYFFLTIGGMIISPLGQIATPRFALLAQTGNLHRLRQLVGLGMLFGAALGLVGAALTIVIGRPVLSLVFTDQVARHADVLVILCLAAALTWANVFAGTAITAFWRFGSKLRIHVAALICGTLAMMAMVPTHGLRGAAWGVVVGAATESLAYALVLWPLLRTPQTRLATACRGAPFALRRERDVQTIQRQLPLQPLRPLDQTCRADKRIFQSELPGVVRLFQPVEIHMPEFAARAIIGLH